MADREEDLRNLTHNGLDDVPRRVFHALTDQAKQKRGFALLVNLLQAKGFITPDELDELLLEAVGSTHVKASRE
jgi:hypothetical protein